MKGAKPQGFNTQRMKEFLKNFKLPLILGGCAVIVVAVTLIIVTGGFSSGYGLYITSAYGSVSITNADVNAAAASGDAIKEGDVITVGEDSSCTLAYKGRKNSEQNYLVAGENTQILVLNDFNGKSDGELYLKSGTVIGNFMGEDKASVNVRTVDASVTMRGSVAKAAYYTNEFMSYTDVYTVMGQNDIQLYDASGSPVNKPETQITPRCGRIVSDEGPEFEWLNVIFDLREFSAFDLKQLLTVSAIVGEDFPFNTEELKAVYSEKSGEPAPDDTAQPDVTEPTDVTTGSEVTSEPENTASPNTETTLPGQTTIRVITRPPQQDTTVSQQSDTTTVPDDTDVSDTDDTSDISDTPDYSDYTGSRAVHTVIINIDGDEMIQEVAHGDSAVKPEDPDIEGLTFVGWDRSFDNITEDTVITALFRETSGDIGTDPFGTVHTVTVVINGNSNTVMVEHGQSADLPVDIIVEGYVFKGWDKDFSNVTSDMTVTAILEPDDQPHIVIFVIDGNNYSVPVEHGGTAVPPYIPSANTGFIGWDKALSNITADTTITAVYNITPSHTVTFMIDGRSYEVTVADGETAVPPFKPTVDSSGGSFAGWSPRDLTNIKSDKIFTAVFE